MLIFFDYLVTCFVISCIVYLLYWVRLLLSSFIFGYDLEETMLEL